MNDMVIGAAISAIFGLIAHEYQMWKRRKLLRPIYGMILFTELKQNLISLAKEQNGGPVFTPTFWESQILELAEILPEAARKYHIWISLVLQRPLRKYGDITDGSYYQRLEKSGYELAESLNNYSPLVDKDDSWLRN